MMMYDDDDDDDDDDDVRCFCVDGVFLNHEFELMPVLFITTFEPVPGSTKPG